MPQFLVEFMTAGQQLAFTRFLRTWLLLLVVIVLVGWLLRKYAMAGVAVSNDHLPERAQKTSETREFADYAFTVLLALFIGSFICLIFYKEDFACHDCDQLTDFSVSGHRFRTPIWDSEGRFFPLGLQEFNFINHVTRTPMGFHSIAAVQLVILAAVLFVVLRECRMAWRALIIMAAIVLPSAVVPFIGLIYPERNILFWLAILIFCLQRVNSECKPGYFLGCLIATHILLYYKEPMVVLAVGYAAPRILLDLYSSRSAAPRSWREFLQRNIVPIGILIVSTIYTLVFLLFMFPFHRINYIDQRRMPKGEMLLAFLQTDWLIALLAIVLAARLARFALGKEDLDPLWDSLALGAMAYCAAILAVAIYADYYLAPTDLIAILYLGRLAARWVPPTFHWRTAVVGLVYVCFFAHHAAYSALRIIDRKEIIFRESELATFLKNYKPENGEARVELFFPKADGYRLAELSSYLDYQGIRLAGHSGVPVTINPEFVIAGTGSYPSGACRPDSRHVCKHEDAPEPGELIVYLPHDIVPESDLEQAAKNAVPLVSTPSWTEDSFAGRGLRFLHVLSIEYKMHRNPQPWWQLYILKKQPSGIESSPKISPAGSSA